MFGKFKAIFIVLFVTTLGVAQAFCACMNTETSHDMMAHDMAPQNIVMQAMSHTSTPDHSDMPEDAHRCAHCEDGVLMSPSILTNVMAVPVQVPVQVRVQIFAIDTFIGFAALDRVQFVPPPDQRRWVPPRLTTPITLKTRLLT